MEETGIILKYIMRGQINPATKPAYRVLAAHGRRHLEVPDIHVDDGHHRMVGMDDNGHAGSEKIILINAERLFYGRGQFAVNGRKVYPALFNNVSILNDAGTAATATFTFPFL